MKIHRTAVYNNKANYISTIAPHVSGNRIIIPEYPRSLILIDTPSLVVCNYIGKDERTFTYHFFIGGPKKVSWEGLNDGLRMTVRTEAGIAFDKFVYRDKRYYTLEALI